MQVSLELNPVELSVVRDPEHFDLHSEPGAIERIEAATLHTPLRSVLTNLNSSGSLFSTFGSKISEGDEKEAEEPFFFASRIDVIFLREDANLGAGPHKALAQRLADLLRKEAGDALRVELQLRQAEFRGEIRGYSLRISLQGKGKSAEQARRRWGLGLARVQQALLFAARELKHEQGFE